MENHEESTKNVIAAMSPEAFANMGAPHLAYIAPVKTEQVEGWGIHAANGNLLGVLESRELAFIAARQNDLEPVSAN